MAKSSVKCVAIKLSLPPIALRRSRSRSQLPRAARCAGGMPYERLLGDAMAGDGALFTREDAVEAAWAVVDRVLKNHRPVRAYRRGGWGPQEADALTAADGGWHNPAPRGEPT